MKLDEGKEKVRIFLGKLKETAASFWSGKILLLGDRLFHRFPAEKRKPLLIGFMGGLFLFFILLIAVIGNSGNSKSSPGILQTARTAIPHEDLFFPVEPDFIPAFILEREPRLFWTAEDAEPYWRPLGDLDFWFREISNAVERLLEGVP